ncbi:hypothetical protein MRX96_037847 [Rhipicephalus microplus]
MLVIFFVYRTLSTGLSFTSYHVPAHAEHKVVWLQCGVWLMKIIKKKCFIALLRADAAVGFADIASPQDSTIAHAQGQGLDGTPSWEATPQVLCRRHDVRSVTSADTDQLGYKTKVHLQRPFSGLGSTFFGRTLMHFCFFVQIALLRADATVGFADIASPQDSIIAHAQGQGLDGTSS